LIGDGSTAPSSIPGAQRGGKIVADRQHSTENRPPPRRRCQKVDVSAAAIPAPAAAELATADSGTIVAVCC
jgi:hypothetical protein